MAILILGGSGFLGCVIAKEIASRGLKFFAPTKRELNLSTLSHEIPCALPWDQITVVINCAVYQRTGDTLVKEAATILEENTRLNLGFLKVLDKVPEAKVISLGASCAFSQSDGSASYIDGQLSDGVRAFALPKRQLAISLSLRNQNEGNWTIFVPPTLIGPGEQLMAEKKHFFNGTLMRAVASLLNDAEFEVFGDMFAEREIMSVENVANYIVDRLGSIGDGIHPIAGGYKVRVGQLYDYIYQHVIPEGKVKSTTTQFLAARQKALTSDGCIDLTNADIATSNELPQLIESTVEYYRQMVDT